MSNPGNSVIYGKTPGGVLLPLNCDASGNLITSASGGGSAVTLPSNLIATNADAVSGADQGYVSPSFLYGWSGTAWDRVRTAKIFKSLKATALGSTFVWTPTAGRKFRLMALQVSICGTLAAAGIQDITFLDNATPMPIEFLAFVNNVVSGDTQIGADFGQGILSAAINQQFAVNLGTAMATGGVVVNAWGTEE